MNATPLLLALAFAAADDEAKDDDEPAWLFTAVVRSLPEGGLIGGEGMLPLTDTLSAGAYLNYMYFWGEMGARLEHRYKGGLHVANAWLGVEPGNFIRSSRSDDVREPGFRALLKLRSELNLRVDWWWIYNRVTLEGRLRTFEERDPFRDAILRQELSFEEAFAPLFRVLSWGDKSMLWLYAEITVAAEVQFGLLDLRPSAGVILEELFEGVTVDVDFYRSLRDDSPIGGYGVLVFVWWRL